MKFLCLFLFTLAAASSVATAAPRCQKGYVLVSPKMCCVKGSVYRNGVCTFQGRRGTAKNQGCGRGEYPVSPTQCCPLGSVLTSDGMCTETRGSPGGGFPGSYGGSAGEEARGNPRVPAPAPKPIPAPGPPPVLPPYVPCTESLCICGSDGSHVFPGGQCNPF